jgi:hypothetical protein
MAYLGLEESRKRARTELPTPLCDYVEYEASSGSDFEPRFSYARAYGAATHSISQIEKNLLELIGRRLAAAELRKWLRMLASYATENRELFDCADAQWHAELEKSDAEIEKRKTARAVARPAIFPPFAGS